MLIKAYNKQKFCFFLLLLFLAHSHIYFTILLYLLLVCYCSVRTMCREKEEMNLKEKNKPNDMFDTFRTKLCSYRETYY